MTHPNIKHRTLSRPAFTLIELMVAIALLTATMVMVAQIFKISTDAASRANAQSEIMAASAAFREQISDQLSKIEPGLLIIDSPAPTEVRAEVPGGEAIFRLRQDRLVFIAGGTTGEFQSFTDPTRGEPTNPVSARFRPVSSSHALIYCGPAIPLDDTGMERPLNWAGDPNPPTASEWVLSSRAILLGAEVGSGYDTSFGSSPAWGAQWNAWDAQVPTIDDIIAENQTAVTILDPRFRDGTHDVVTDSATHTASAVTLLDRISSVIPLPNNAALPMAGHILDGLWQPNRAPRAASLDLSDPAYYGRTGFNFQPRLADIRIEWTDGRPVDLDGPDDNVATTADNNLNTRWFGLRPDPSASPDPANIASVSNLNYGTVRRADTLQIYPNTVPPKAEYLADAQERALFNNRIESGVLVAPNAAYRAVWRRDTWAYRPKALRITYRLFDSRARLGNETSVDLDEDGLTDPDGSATKYVLKRYGIEFSIVVPVG